ncbi:MAG: Na-Ca exchanger/integrin-beta4 [Phycisphaerales bacterium]|nr:Na-Ca exchanger/integrin-beta4 [Phycisphaerales bacterium]
MFASRNKTVPVRRFSPGGFPATSHRRASASAKRRPAYRAEALERRCLLSAVTWTGAHNNGLWTDPLNWTGGTGVPTASDNVTIGSGFTTISIPSGTQSINSLTCASPLQINGGSLVLAATSTVSTLTISSGTLDGAGNVTVTGALTWSGGTMQGTGKTVSAATGTLSIDTTTHFLSRTLESDGTASWTAGTLAMIGGTFNNNGSFTFNSAATCQSQGAGFGTNAFNNVGSFTKLGTGEVDFRVPSQAPYRVPFNNTGTVSVQAGTLGIKSGGTSSGNMTATATGTLLFAIGYTYNAGATVTGAGTIAFSSGTYTFATGQFNPTGTVNFTGGTITINDVLTPTALGTIGANVTFNNALNYTGAVSIDGYGSASFATAESFSSLTLSGDLGTLAGAGDVTVTGALVWSGGTMQGTGKTISAATGTLSIDTGGTLNRVLESDGTATWTSGNLLMNGGTLNNNGSFTFDSATTWASYGGFGGTSTFNNAGSFTKQGAGEVDFFTGSAPVAFNNTGTVSVQAGVMSLGTVPNLSGGTLTGGTWDVFSNGKLRLPGSVTALAANVLLNSAGSITIDSYGDSALTGVAAIASGGSLSLQGGRSLSTTPAGGTFTNHSTINLGAGSRLSVAGAFTQGTDGTLVTQLSGPTSASFGQVSAFGTTTVSGTATVGGTLQATLGAGYDPAAGQTFSVVTGSSRAGSFSNFSGGATPGGLPLLLNYSTTSATISINPIPLSYAGTQIDDGNRQRSLVRSVTFSFSTPVTLSVGAITLALLNTGYSGTNNGAPPTDASVALGTPTTSDGGVTWIVPIQTSSAFSAFGSLIDGIYTATVHANLVTDALSEHLGGDQTTTFHRLYGDINGDKRISNADFTFFSNAYNAIFGQANYNQYFDFTNKNAKIGNSDFTQFANRYNKMFVYAG